MRKMRILLTGGSGTVGMKVLEQLSTRKDYEVVAFDLKTKHSKKAYEPFKGNITLQYGDISNFEDVANVCRGIDYVIHLAAIIPPIADEKPTLAHKINVVGTENLIKALVLHSPSAFFLYASSVSVYGDRINEPFIYVGDPLQPSFGDAYAKTKILAEKSLQESNLDWSIFRLSAIMGTDNHKISGLMFHMPLSTSMEITTPHDTASAFVNSIGKREELSRRIFNLGGGAECRISYGEFLSRSFEIFGLGELNFPQYSFADKNFHCGFYADGDDLEEIVSFRNDTIDTYFQQVASSVSPFKKFLTRLFRKSIKRHLIKKSEPFHAYNLKDKTLLERFFNFALDE